MIVIKKCVLAVVIIIALLCSLTTMTATAAKVNPKPSGINDSSVYLIDVPDEGNHIYYAGWKAHGLGWTSFKMFCKLQYDSEIFAFSDSSGYIYTKTINNENFYEAEFNMGMSSYNIAEGCGVIAFYPTQIQFDKKAFESGESFPLGNYIDTSAYKYVATRLKVESENKDPKKLSVMLRAKGRDQYIDRMGGAYIVNKNTRKITGPIPDFNYVELESDFDGWVLMPVAKMAEGKPLSELISVSFFCHSQGLSDKCGHRIEDTSWTDSTLYIGDMMLVKDADAFNKARTSCSLLGHSYSNPVIVPSTTDKNGTSTKTCTACGKKESTTLPKLVATLSGSSVEGLKATAQISGNSNIHEKVILKAQNITSSIATANRNVIIDGVNTLKDQIKSRKIISILDLRLITRTKNANGKNTDTAFSSTGNIKLTVPVDTAALNKYNDISLVYVKDAENAEIVDYTVSNGVATFETDSFGYFAFVGRPKSMDTSSDSSDIVSSDKVTADTESETVKEEESVKVIKNGGNKQSGFSTTKIIILISLVILAIGAFATSLIFIIKTRK